MARLMMELQKLVGPKRQRSIRPALIIAELDLVHAGNKALDNRAHLAPSKRRCGDVFQQRYRR